MEMWMILLGSFAGAVLLFLVIVASVYNGLIEGRNGVREAFSGVHVQLKRRADLVPNLVSAVRGYLKHESEVLEKLTDLRTRFLSTKSSDRASVIEQDSQMSQALKSVFAVSESYPDLKASGNFLKLQESLEETEDQIAAARRIYNANVSDYNTEVQSFPANLIASRYGFWEEPFFRAEESASEVPAVKLD